MGVQPIIKNHQLARAWAHFDRIYCISLDERKDRRKAAEISFHDVGLLDKVEFVIEKKHPLNCEKGIFESHMKCIEKGLLADAKNITIFEDDIIFERFSLSKLNNVIDFMSRNSDWDIIFFGCMVSKSKRTGHESILKIKHRSLSHAYVLNRKFAETLVKRKWEEIPFDDLLSDMSWNHFAVFPSFAFQSNSPSDNVRYLPLDRFRRICGGLCRIQKSNEFYHRNKALIVTLHVILILIFAAIFL